MSLNDLLKIVTRSSIISCFTYFINDTLTLKNEATLDVRVSLIKYVKQEIIDDLVTILINCWGGMLSRGTKNCKSDTYLQRG